MALGIPIKIVVLTIVGMAGLAAMLVIIDNGENAIPKQLRADLKSSNIIILPAFNGSEYINVEVEVIDTIEGTSVEKASVALSGLGAISVNMTDNDGYTILRLKRTDLDLKAGEGYLQLDVKANGFQDYSNEYAVKIVI